MKKIAAFLSIFWAQSLLAHDLPIKLSANLEASQKMVIEHALDEVSQLLPSKFKAGLPRMIELTVGKLTDHQSIPNDICTAKVQRDDKTQKKSSLFIYSEYGPSQKVLTLNSLTIKELARGRMDSEKINCQHQSLYGQAIASIIHELTLAYDFNNQNISYRKRKNNGGPKSLDPSLLKSIAETYALNMEYFTMDPEYACRRPAMFDYFKRSFEVDPYPNRQCSLNNTVIMSTPIGYYPVKLEAKRIYRIDYLAASSNKDLAGLEKGIENPMFRIIMCAPDRFDPATNKMIAGTPFGPKCLADKIYHMVVSFKGLFGGHPSKLFVLKFADVLDEYNQGELRDIISYPLTLSNREKEEFIHKIIEEHWSYRSLELQTNGPYAFVIKGNGEEFDHSEFISLKKETQELFKAHTGPLLKAFEAAYSEKANEGKKDKKALLKFINSSKVEDRLAVFDKFSKAPIEAVDLHSKLSFMKSRLIKASSFSVMEQQILRYKTSELKKRMAKDERIKKLLFDDKFFLKQDFTKSKNFGYGVPLFNEMLGRRESDARIEQSKIKIENLERLSKELAPEEFEVLDAIDANIENFGQKSLGLRREFRKMLEVYIHQVIVNLSYEDGGRMILAKSLRSKESLNKVRDLLDKDLVSDEELLDARLRNMIEVVLK